MSERVDPAKIEAIVGIERQRWAHYANAVSKEQVVYVLHSHACLMQYGVDLTQCPFSLALDKGIDLSKWVEDVALEVKIDDDSGRLVPAVQIVGR